MLIQRFTRGELFNVADDPAQRVNRYAERPELVQRLAGRLGSIRGHYVPSEGS